MRQNKKAPWNNVFHMGLSIFDFHRTPSSLYNSVTSSENENQPKKTSLSVYEKLCSASQRKSTYFEVFTFFQERPWRRENTITNRILHNGQTFNYIFHFWRNPVLEARLAARLILQSFQTVLLI